jgi:phage protein D
VGIKPFYKIVANSSDITAAIRERFVSLRVTDKTGKDSDQMSLTLADHDPQAPMELPPRGAEIQVSLGYDDQVERLGLYIVDKIKATWPPDQIRITASATPLADSESGEGSTRKMMQSKKTRSWDKGTTLGGLTETIAGEHGLSPLIQSELAGIALPHIDQTSESDMALLLRVAGNYDAVAKPADAKLIVAKRAESRAATGQSLPTVSIPADQITTGDVDISERRALGKVIARYRDADTAETVEVTSGEGEPVEELADVYPDEETARSAAQSRLDGSTRAGKTLNITTPGDARLMAEGRISITGARPGANGEWLITEVVHDLSVRGWVTTAKCEAP